LGANDLDPGDSGIVGRNIKRKASSSMAAGGGGGGGSKKRKQPCMIYYMDYAWTAEEEDGFEVEAIVGVVTADGRTSYANQGKAKAGTILFRIVWKDYPPDMIWYEPAENVGTELREQFEARMAAETAADAQAVREEAELKAELAALEEAEAMPPQ